ncbi:hypothetical protein I4Q42_09380 [Caulobacter hibisci]|uniref:Alpha/beta hydrolase n=1 Tax=Caulobacter hibisci TaxID=2035993 RepID=A0ABS0SYB3_9CAUL|nr:hypothetical protein [Caulobacter hibisci]MBI1683880.1 hypothetical protein [Caulobacter hibisci]
MSHVRTWRDGLRATGRIAAATLAIIGSLVAVTLSSASPRDPGRVAAIFPPWWSAARAASAAAAAGDISGAGAVPFILILRGDPATLGQRLHAAGALVLLDPERAGVCAAKSVLEPRP